MIFEKAVAADETDQIFGAKDDDGDYAIHKAALCGNPTCLDWIIGKWKEAGEDLDIDEPDHSGVTPLYLVCYKGYLGADSAVANRPMTKQKRIECVNILINAGADVNFMTPKLGMTPLHWAAYQGDSEMIQLLLDKGAKQNMTINGNTPVDIAGFMKHQECI